MLAVVLILSVIVLPAVAADVQRRFHICPKCGGSGYVEWETHTVQSTYTVSSCEVCDYSHQHADYVDRIWTMCEDCGLEWPTWSRVSVYCAYILGYL